MSDPRARGSAGAAVAGAIASLVLLSVLIPVAIAFFALVLSAPFFGEQPSAPDLARTASGLWTACAVAAVSFVIVLTLAIVNRGRPASAVVVILAVIAGVALLFWLAVAAGSDRRQPEVAPSPAAPSPAATLVDGRYVPDETGIAAAETLIAQLQTVTFPADSGPGQVARLVTAVGGRDPEVRGTEGDELVGVFVGHRACVIGSLRDGVATWSVAGLSDDGGCLGPVHA